MTTAKCRCLVRKMMASVSHVLLDLIWPVLVRAFGENGETIAEDATDQRERGDNGQDKEIEWVTGLTEANLMNQLLFCWPLVDSWSVTNDFLSQFVFIYLFSVNTISSGTFSVIIVHSNRWWMPPSRQTAFGRSWRVSRATGKGGNKFWFDRT